MKRVSIFFLKLFMWFGVLSILWVLFYKFVPVAYTPLMAIRYTNGSSDYESRHYWMPIEEISPNLQLAVVCAEDQNFLDHNGFDYEAIKRAFSENKIKKRTKGGSTISQQTAKNVFLWPERSWLRKGFEVYFTFLIENLWGKDRILEVYLNSIEMGDGVYGAEAASDYWFNKKAKHLTRQEAASIAAILPNPRKFKANPRTNYLERRKTWIMKQMQNYGYFELTKVGTK
ncbi:MAG: monofunctional biosynthetic peptidoglycan transglycosylase [Flavobacteriaceae bacterium]|jgi:monofunctional biosynthetic peptidoglycan transglycosylase